MTWFVVAHLVAVVAAFLFALHVRSQLKGAGHESTSDLARAHVRRSRRSADRRWRADHSPVTHSAQTPMFLLRHDPRGKRADTVADARALLARGEITPEAERAIRAFVGEGRDL